MMYAIVDLIDTILEIYTWVLIGSAIFSWLLAFNVLDTRNRLVYTLGDFFYRVTEPVLRPIRRFVPLLGGVDVSFIVLILAIWFVRKHILTALLFA